MCIRLLYQMLVLASIFCQCILCAEPDQCPSIVSEAPMPDNFWPLAKKLLVEEQQTKQTDKNDDQNDDHDNKLISEMVDDLEAKDKQMEQEMKLQELCMMGNNDQNGQNQNIENPKIESKIVNPNKKWYHHRRFSFRRSNTMKNIDNLQQQEQSRTQSSSSPLAWFRTFSSLRRLSSSKLNMAEDFNKSGAVLRSYSMRQNPPDELEKMLTSDDDKNCENDIKLGLQVYKESKELQREIMSRKNDPKCMVAKFGAIKMQIFNMLDIVAAKLGITLKKEYESKETEKPVKYSSMAMVKKVTKLWITAGKGTAMDKSGMAKVLDMVRDVMVMAESKLVLPNPNGFTHRRRKRMEPLIIAIIGLAVVLVLVILFDLVFLNGRGCKTIIFCRCFRRN